MTPDRPFSFRIGDNLLQVKPDPEAEGKSLLIINGELHHADFRVSIPDGAKHAIRCKRYGHMLGVKLDGGWCVCPENECRDRGDKQKNRAPG